MENDRSSDDTNNGSTIDNQFLSDTEKELLRQLASQRLQQLMLDVTTSDDQLTLPRIPCWINGRDPTTGILGSSNSCDDGSDVVHPPDSRQAFRQRDYFNANGFLHLPTFVT